MPLNRRDFLKLFGKVAGAAAVAPYLPPLPPDAPVQIVPAVPKKRYHGTHATISVDGKEIMRGPFTQSIEQAARPITQPVGGSARLHGMRPRIYLNGQELPGVRAYSLDLCADPGPGRGPAWKLERPPDIRTTLHIEAVETGKRVPLFGGELVDIEIHPDANSTDAIATRARLVNAETSGGAGRLTVYDLTFTGSDPVVMTGFA